MGLFKTTDELCNIELCNGFHDRSLITWHIFTIHIHTMSSTGDNIPVFIWIFQFCSILTPISNNKFLLKNISFVLWFVAHFGLALLELSLIYAHQNETFHSGSNIGRILDIVQVILPIATHLVLIVETIFNWNTQLEMWQCIQSVEKRTKLIGIEINSFMKTYLIEISTLAFVGMVTEAIVIALITDDESFVRSWYYRLWSLYMIRFGIMQLIFYLEWIKCQIIVIREGLHTAKNGIDKLKLLYELKNLYSDIWLFSVRFNKRFSWSILALTVHLFITIIITFYWIVARLYFHVYSALLASSFICISPITNLLVLLYSCQQCLTQVNTVMYSPKCDHVITVNLFLFRRIT